MISKKNLKQYIKLLSILIHIKVKMIKPNYSCFKNYKKIKMFKIIILTKIN